MPAPKKLNIPDEIRDIIAKMEIKEQDGAFIGILHQELDRPTYLAFAKAIKALGGAWNRKIGGQIFSEDPRQALGLVLDTGIIEVARDGWFWTPVSVVDQMSLEIKVDPGAQRVLEPSAGEGHIADILFSWGFPLKDIDCVELNPKRAEILRSKGYPVFEQDFLTFKPSWTYSRIFMNPPFENGQDIDHVRHAYSLLLPGPGRLASVVSEGVFFRSDSKATGFWDWLEEVRGYSIKLPDQSFRKAGTDVATRLVIIHRKGYQTTAPVTKQLNLFD